MQRHLSLICCGATSATKAALFPCDEKLLPQWRKRAETLAGTVKNSGAAVFCGPEKRGAETTAALGLSPVIEGALRDWDHGDWAGKALSEIAPEAVAAWLSDPDSAPHGGESLSDLIARVGEWIGQRSERRIVAVTHPAVIRATIVSALGAPASLFWRLDVAPLGRAELSHDGRRWSLRALNGPVSDRSASADRYP